MYVSQSTWVCFCNILSFIYIHVVNGLKQPTYPSIKRIDLHFSRNLYSHKFIVLFVVDMTNAVYVDLYPNSDIVVLMYWI